MMQYLRQLGSGLILAIFSVFLVVGGVFLSLAETAPALATPTQVIPTFPLSFATPTATVTPFLQSEIPTTTPSETQTALPTVTLVSFPTSFPTSFSLPAPASCTPPFGWVRVITRYGDTLYSLAQRYKTRAENLAAANCLPSFNLPAGFALYVPPIPTVTVIPCGPPPGWVRAYTVQPGDTLYRIASSYGLSYYQLQRANCMGNSTAIYTGMRLWVPNLPTRTPVPGVTTIPSLPTETSPAPTNTPPATQMPTEIPTSAPSATSAPTPLPTATSAPPPTQAPPATDPPLTPPSSQ